MSSEVSSNTAAIHELAASYTLNALDSFEKAQFEEHLRQGCSACEAELRSFTQVADAIGKSVEASPSTELRHRLQSRLKRSPQVPGVLLQHSGLLISRSEEISWRALAPGIVYKPLHQDSDRKYSTSLVRMDSGAYYPEHRHADIEELFVLSGDLHVEGEAMRSGDYCRAESGTIHGETFTDGGCLFLMCASQANQLLSEQAPA